MRVLGYGENSMTLWVLQNHTDSILHHFSDDSDHRDCLAFYVPSFGRRSDRGQFGEPDFILCSRRAVYLGETKWHGTTGWRNGVADLSALRPRQETFRFYLERWFKFHPRDWADFLTKIGAERPPKGGYAPTRGRVTATLETVLSSIVEFYGRTDEMPPVVDVLLYVHGATDGRPREVRGGFDLVAVSCAEVLERPKGGFVPLHQPSHEHRDDVNAGHLKRCNAEPRQAPRLTRE